VPEDRLDKLIVTIYAVGGGAAALSMAIFLRSESLELGPDLVAALQVSWAALFYALVACALVQFLRLFGPPAGLRRLLHRVFLASGFFAFLLGLVVLAYVSAVALADANAEDAPESQNTAI
jgi:hypothetical protein